MSQTEVGRAQPQMRIRLPAGVERTVAELVATQTRRGRKRRRGEAPLDNWSWAHVASGAGLALSGVSWGWAFGLLVGFEALEGALRRARSKEAGGLFEYESWPNIAADVMTGMIGFAGARLLMGRPFARVAMNAVLPLLPRR